MPEAIIQSLIEIEELITNEKKKIVDVKALIDKLNEQKEQLEEVHKLKLEQLETEHNKIIEELEHKNKEIEEAIQETDEKTAVLSEKYKNNLAKITDKIVALKNTRLGFIEAELSEKADAVDNELKNVEAQTQDFLIKKNNYTEKYNKKIKELDQKFINLRKKELDIKTELSNTKKTLIKEKEQLIKEQEAEKAALIKKNKGIIEEAKRANEEKLREIEAKQNYIIKTRMDELEQIKERSKVILDIKDKAIKDNDLAQNRMTKEISLIEKRFNREIEILNKENDKLRNNLFDAEQDLLKLTNDNAKALEKKKDEYQEYLKFLGVRKKAKIEELTEKLDKCKAKEKEKLSNFINNLDEKYEELVIEKNKTIDELNEQLAQETASLDEKIKNDNNLFDIKNGKYKEEISRIESETEKQREQTNIILEDYNAKIRKMKEELTEMENKNKVELEKLTSEYTFLMQESKVKHEEKCAKLKEKVNEANSRIVELNADVEDARNDFKNFINILNEKRDLLINNQNENLVRLNNEKDRINDRIFNIQKQMQEDIVKQKNSLDEIDNNRTQSLNEYNESIENLEKSYKEDVDRIYLENENRIKTAKDNFEARAEQLSIDTKRLKDNITQEIENKKKDYAEQNELLAKLNMQLQEEYDTRIANAQVQRDGLLKKIEEAKKQYEDSYASFNETRAQIIAKQDIEVNQLKEKQLKTLRDMVTTYELQPAQELDAVRKELELRTIEHDKELENIQIEKEQNEKEFLELENAHNAIRKEAEETLKDVEKTYESFVQEREEKLKNLNSELEQKQLDYQAYKDKLNNDIQDIKESHVAEEKTLQEQLDSQYEETKKTLQNKYEIAQRQFDQEISAYKNDLAIKLKDYDDMIVENGEKRTKLEEEYAIKFEVEDNKTKEIQKQLDEQLENNVNQQAEWKKLIALKKDEMSSQLDSIKTKYDQIVEDKRVEYVKHIEDVKGKIEDIKKEMVGYDADKQAKLTELNKYKSEIDSKIADIKSVTDDILGKVQAKSNELARDAATLEATYRNKEKFIKKQIDECIKEFISLEKARPSIIQEEVDRGTNQLLIKTQDFKDKLADLNKSNQEILDKLESTKKQTLNQISIEISELINGKRNILIDHTEELENIARTYEKLLREEKQRQINVEEQIRKAKLERTEEYGKFVNENQAVSNGFLEGKKNLDIEFSNKSNELTEEYKPQVIELTKELLNLESNKTVVISDIKDIKSEYDRKSEELEETKLALLKEYADKMKDINESYEVAINENREKLKSDDAINGVILDIFKK